MNVDATRMPKRRDNEAIFLRFNGRQADIFSGKHIKSRHESGHAKQQTLTRIVKLMGSCPIDAETSNTMVAKRAHVSSAQTLKAVARVLR